MNNKLKNIGLLFISMLLAVYSVANSENNQNKAELEVYIRMTTTKEIGETIRLWVDADEADKSSIWIDLNNNQRKDAGEDVNFGLEGFSLSGNSRLDYKITSQTITIYGKIRTFACSSNQLTKLDVSKNINLERIICDGNQITELDVSKNTRLYILWCDNNPNLSKLNVANGNNENFVNESIYCTLNATNCPKLRCIQVDEGFDSDFFERNGNLWEKDDVANWRNDCTSCD